MESSAIVCVIHAVDTLTQGAANSLLKFLEEPTGNIHFILLTEQLSKVLITIQSRCQIIRFQSDAGEKYRCNAERTRRAKCDGATTFSTHE